MNDNFWNGFEKRASAIQAVVRGAQSAGKKLSGWGQGLAKGKNPGWFKGNIGKGLQQSGDWIAANPRKAIGGAAVAGAGGAGYMMGSRNQNVNVYR